MFEFRDNNIDESYEELNKPRYMNVKYIFDTVDKEIKIMTANDLDVPAEELGLKGSPTKVKKSFTKGAKTAGKVFEVDSKEAAKIIMDKLKEKYII